MVLTVRSRVSLSMVVKNCPEDMPNSWRRLSVIRRLGELCHIRNGKASFQQILLLFPWDNKFWSSTIHEIPAQLCRSKRLHPDELKLIVDPAPLGSRDGAVVRALASHQCVPGSIPGPGVIRGLSLLFSAPRGFSPVFPSPQQPTLPNSNSSLNKVVWFDLIWRPEQGWQVSHWQNC